MPSAAGSVATSGSAGAAAAVALDLVGSDPRAAVEAAHEAVRLAGLQQDAAAASTAQRALGLARRALGDLPGALLALRAAVRTAEAAGRPEPAAEARMSLAFALLERGRVAAALREADLATGALTGLAAARLRAQRALVLQRSGRLEEALEDFRHTLPELQRAGDRLWEARLRTNRAVLLADRGNLTEAAQDFVRAGSLYTELGQGLPAADATWGLGFVAARRGDLRTALTCYDATADRYAAAGVPVPELLVDRAEVLLSAGLVEEAQTCVETAVQGLRGLLRHTSLAEAQLLQAQCTLAAGDAERARQMATTAEHHLRRQGRRGWSVVARYVGLRAADAAGEPLEPGAAVRLADALEAAGWRVLALDARIIAARAALTTGRVGLAETQLRRATAARRGTVEQRVRAWYAEALLRQAHGRHRAVTGALRAGLRAVDEHRASLGATELRVHASSHGAELARLGLDAALHDRAAVRVLEWSERFRAGAARLRPVTPPADGELAQLLAQLRQVSAQLESALLDGRAVAAIRSRQAALEREVRLSSRRLNGPRQVALEVASVAALQAALTDKAKVLVVYLVHDGALYAVVLDGRRVSLHALGSAEPPVRALNAVHFALRRLAAVRSSSRALTAALAAADHAANGLHDALVAPLLRDLGDRPLVVVPTAALHAVPWALLPALRGRSLVVAPSATVWHRAAGRPATGTCGVGLLVAGPGLPAADAEVRTLAGLHPAATCLLGAAADTESVLTALGRAEWAHVAAHGTLRTDNPLFSALTMADGSLTVYDLERLPQVPGLVALPVCESAVGSVHAGEEVLGLASALLSLGTRTLVATVVPVPDDASRELMLGMHGRLTAGNDVPAALAQAQADLPRDDPAGLAAVAGFGCLGA